MQSISLSKDKGHYNHANKMIFDNKFIYFYFVNLTWQILMAFLICVNVPFHGHPHAGEDLYYIVLYTVQNLHQECEAQEK